MPSLSGRPSRIYEGALNTVGIDIGVLGAGARRLPSPRNVLASDAAIGNLSG